MVLIVAPFTCVLFVIFFLGAIYQDVPRPFSKGESIAIASLAPNEEIVVSKLFSDRNTKARDYHLRRRGAETEISIFEDSVAWPYANPELTPAKLLTERVLTLAEAKGLDATVAFFREVREEESSARRHYRLTYFRDGKKIGEEFYIGFSLSDRLAYDQREGTRGSADYDLDLQRLAEDYRFPVNRIRQMVAFEMLEDANKGTTSGTLVPLSGPNP